MRKKRYRMESQRGYLLIMAVIFILVIGVMGSLMAYLFSNRAMLSAAQQNGLKTFYMAESALEIGTRLLLMPGLSGTPSRLACANLSGTASITHATLDSGTFTITAINHLPFFAVERLSSAVTATTTTITTGSTASFAPRGRIVIDREAMDYTDLNSTTFLNVTRGANGTLASSHAAGAGIGQYQCSLDVQSGIPDLISPNYQRDLQWSVQLQDGWVVGNASGNNFVFAHWNQPSEISWNALTVVGGVNASNQNRVNMLSHADGWSVGNEAGNQFILLHWNGATWQLNAVNGACTGQNLNGLSMISSQEGWAVGARYRSTNCNSGSRRYTLMRWNGSSWSVLTPSTSPSIPADNNTNQNLNAVHVIDTNGDGLGDIGFAVGDNGTIIQFNGSNWVATTSPTTRNLNGLFTVSSSEAWAVGAGGTILKWNGSTWNTVSSPTTAVLNDIAMLDTNGDGVADAGWAVGNSGTILIYNGSTWSSSKSGNNNNLLGIDIFNAKEAWASGASGTLLHWDGNSWTSVSAGLTQSLNSISLIPISQKPVSAWRQVFH